MCHLTPTVLSLQQAIPNGCPAKMLGSSQRRTIGMQAVVGTQTITGLADEYDVSRKFVYQQAATADKALQEAFAVGDANAKDKQVLFHLPVTKAWLQQATLGLVLICHSSFRGVVELFRDLFGVNTSVGTVHNIVRDAVDKARAWNRQYDLGNIRIPALDEIFQKRRPVLVGADIASTFCFLLSLENNRDAQTWGLRLLEAQEQGLAPDAAIADFAKGIRAGLELVMPGVGCWGDVFHALYEVMPVVTFLENRAYDAIATHDKLAHKKTKIKTQGGRNQKVVQQTYAAQQTQTQAIALADDVALLARWLQNDVLAVSGLCHADRCALFDFLVAELQARTPLCPHRLGPVCTFLKNNRDDILAFAAQLDHNIDALAAKFQVASDVVREFLDLHTRDQRQPAYWQRQLLLRQKLRGRFHALNKAVRRLARTTVRASSVIENLNSRLRSYFFLRRHLGADYLTLLQFFLNHRRFLRSKHGERVGKSPAELLTGASHAHWLEMLGYQRFSRN